VVGDLEVARATCALLSAEDVDVVHLLHPSDTDLSAHLDETIDAVAILVRGDVTALRYSLLVEHIRPGIRLVVTVFDRTLSEQLLRTLPNCEISSPADIAVPSIVAACLADGSLAVDCGGPVPRRLVRGEERLEFVPVTTSGPGLVHRLGGVFGRFRAHDDATRILVLGLLGLLGVLLVDWLLTVTVLGHGAVDAWYAATRVVTTVGPGDADAQDRPWYALLASVLMLVTVILTAIFTAGVVNRLLSSRSLSLVGRATPPRRDHVVIVGLGQVGLRLAVALRRLRVPVIVIERDAAGPNLRLARSFGVPVFLGHGQDREVLERVGLGRARALAAMGSDDLDNVEMAIAAAAVAPRIPIALRAGEDDVIAETRSLFRVGEVCDVSALTAASVVRSMVDLPPVAVFTRDHHVVVFDGEHEWVAPAPQRCECADGA
jgi:hypothetical protein